MKILLTSKHFFPVIGGVPAVVLALAAEFQKAGHEVRILTATPGTFPGEGKFCVIRTPSIGETLRQFRWAEVVLLNDVSIRLVLPLFLVSRPVVVGLHWAYLAEDYPLYRRWLPIYLRWLFSRFQTVACSEIAAVAGKRPSVVINNPYDNQTFRNVGKEREKGRLLFVGRLTEPKGLPDLVSALVVLRDKGVRCQLEIVGDGDFADEMKSLVTSAGLDASVRFLGKKLGDDLAGIYNSHRLLLVPSWQAEPAPIVVLEAIACGCAVIGSQVGNLPKVIGSCGFTYPSRDVPALASCIERFANADWDLPGLERYAAEHLSHYEPARVAEKYLIALEAAKSGFQH